MLFTCCSPLITKHPWENNAKNNSTTHPGCERGDETYPNNHIVRIARLERPPERDGGVRQVLVSAFHVVILGVVLNRRSATVLATVAVLQEKKNKKKRQSQYYKKPKLSLAGAKYDYRDENFGGEFSGNHTNYISDRCLLSEQDTCNVLLAVVCMCGVPHTGCNFMPAGRTDRSWDIWSVGSCLSCFFFLCGDQLMLFVRKQNA